jgi:hypothetical protein
VRGTALRVSLLPLAVPPPGCEQMLGGLAFGERRDGGGMGIAMCVERP